MPLRKKLRNGQMEVIKAAEGKRELNVQLPTGYGKTFTACALYAVLQRHGLANRILYITPTIAQHEQFVSGGHDDLNDAAVEGPHKVKDVAYFKAAPLKEHIKDTCQVFAINIQAMITRDGMDRVNALMEKGKWLIVADEYHHYGIEKKWGMSVCRLDHAFRLAMSATPARPDDDSAFGNPDVVVTYRQAKDEEAVKPLVGHSYTYRVDAITIDPETGEPGVVSYTTSELKSELGEGDQMERRRIERKMRFSPKYISPLVSKPLERLISMRMSTGYKLQAIIGAMGVHHAEVVCDQVRSMFPELSVDWVGTKSVNGSGETFGRSPEENKKVLQKFCPPKVDGNRTPALDVLVHVGMAGEGLDSILVSEVIHLNSASINNSNNQENGRAARFLPGITGHINFDSCSGYRDSTGDAIMDAMDMVDPSLCDKCKKLPCECERKDPEYSDMDIPEVPHMLVDCELIKIDSGEPDVQRVMKMLAENKEFKGVGITKENILDKENVELAIEITRQMRMADAEKHNEKNQSANIGDQINYALSGIVSAVIRRVYKGTSTPVGIAGDLKIKINKVKKMAVGQLTEDVSVRKKHYDWLYRLMEEIKTEGVPSWLA